MSATKTRPERTATAVMEPRHGAKKHVRRLVVSQDRFYYAGGVCYHGRSANGRLGWQLPENKACMDLVKRGLGHEAIAKATGLTRFQIAYRCRKVGLSVMDFRRGTSDEAQKILTRFTVTYK